MSVVNINDPAALVHALRAGDTTADFDLGRGSLRSALAAVLPHVGDLMSLDRVRLQFEPDAGMVTIASNGVSVAVASVHVDSTGDGQGPCVVDIEGRSAREVLAVLVPPRDKEARGNWDAESFRVTATDEEVTFTEESELLDGRSLTVPRLPHRDDEGRHTIYPDYPRRVAELLEAPLAHDVDTALGPDLLGAWIKTAKVVDSALEVSPRQRPDGKPGMWAVSVGGRVVGGLVPRHPDEDHQDRVLPTWARRLWRVRIATNEEADRG